MSLTPASDAKPLHPEGWVPPHGYIHGLSVSGRMIVLAGQIGWNPKSVAFETDDFVAQVRQALENIATLLKEAGALPAHLVRLTSYITDRSEYVSAGREIGVAYREVIGTHYPPMSVMVVSGLVEKRAKVEIEATAVIPE